MYCKNCGADEPEIRINNRDYCSNCGLPNEESKVDVPKEIKREDPKKGNNELSSAFSELKSTIDEKSGGSYRSKDFRIIPRKDKTDETDSLSKSTSKPLQEEIEESLGLKEPSKVEPLKQEPTPEPEALGTELSDQKEALINEINTIVQKEDQKLESDKSTNTNNPKTSEVRAIYDEKETTSEPKLDDAIKKVDELGAANRLIDILEDGLKEKALEQKIEKNRGIGEDFGKLIDILNQPIEKPTTKEPEKGKGSDELEKSINSLNDTKELTSPLDTREITEHSSTTEEKSPIFDITEEETPKETKSRLPKIGSKKAKTLPENLDKERMPEIEKADLEKIETIESPEVTEELPDIIEPEDPVQEIEEASDQIEKEAEQDTNEEENELNLEDQIHGLGDKKGHIDHWPEEEIVHVAMNEIKGNQDTVLTDYVKNLFHHEPKEQPKSKKDTKQKKKKKINRKSKKTDSTKSHIYILITIIILLVSFIGLLLLINTKNNKVQEVSSDTLQLIQLKIIEPGYIPTGYEKESNTENDGNKARLSYAFLADRENKIILQERKIDKDFSLQDYAKENSKSYTFKQTSVSNYYILDNKKITWTSNELQFILEREGDLNIEELVKIMESMR